MKQIFFLITLCTLYTAVPVFCADQNNDDMTFIDDLLQKVQKNPNTTIPHLVPLLKQMQQQDIINMIFLTACSNKAVSQTTLAQLIKLKANVNEIISIDTMLPQTALSWAAHYNNLDLTHFLLSQGANACISDCNNNTALFFALKAHFENTQEQNTNNLALINLLEQHGASAIANDTIFSCILQEIGYDDMEENIHVINRNDALVTLIEKSLINALPALLHNQNHCKQLIHCAQKHDADILLMLYTYGLPLDETHIKNLELQENDPEHLYRHAICGTLTSYPLLEKLNEAILMTCFKHALLGNFATLHATLLTLIKSSSLPIHDLVKLIKNAKYKNSSEFFTALVTHHFNKSLFQQQLSDTTIIFKNKPDTKRKNHTTLPCRKQLKQ